MDLRQQLGVETPEHVEVHLELAGVGSRTAAAFFDTVLLNLGVILIVVVARTIGTRLSGAVEGWLMAALVLLYYFAVLGYFVLFEALNGGRTPGKQALGVRVVMATRHPPTPTPARGGNLVRLLDQFMVRRDQLDPMVELRMAAELARRFEARVPRRTTDTEAYLATLLAEEQRKRRGRFATQAREHGAGRTTVAAERFVARKRAAWEVFRAVATRVERAGVGALPPDEIPAFAARYREAAGDLARARREGVDPRVIEYLERLVSAGHNALYRARGRRRTPVLRYVLRDFPAAVVLSWRQVVAAALLFVVPAGVGYVMIRERPQLAEEVMSPVMVGRAEQAAERQARGIGYAQSPEEELPVIASAIIGNNVLVAFWTFVGGLVAGTLTVWALVMNGLQLGMGFGLFVNHRAGAYLATFIAGHGVLELTAIFIAAGAGFRIAGALIAPGDRTRRDALVVEGRIAAQMLGAVVSLLVVAGTIEGLLSASDAPAALKYAVSATSAVLLVLYLRNGWAASIAATAPAP